MGSDGAQFSDWLMVRQQSLLRLQEAWGYVLMVLR